MDVFKINTLVEFMHNHNYIFCFTPASNSIYLSLQFINVRKEITTRNQSINAYFR